MRRSSEADRVKAWTDNVWPELRQTSVSIPRVPCKDNKEEEEDDERDDDHRARTAHRP
jgi:hypothetical protein